MGRFWEQRQNLWTSREEEQLTQLVAEKLSNPVIAAKLGRTTDSVRTKVGSMRLRRTPESPWNPQSLAMLRRMRAEGTSFSAIGSAIGLSRNACIGKARREGLPIREQGKAPISPPRERKTRFQAKAPLVKAPQLAPEPFQRVVRADVPAPLNKSILELPASACRWPVTDEPPHLFCGHPAVADCSYCAAHMWIAHDRRPDRDLNRGTHFAMK